MAKLEDIEHDETPILNQEEGHSKQNNQEIPSQSQQDSDHTNSNIESSPNQSGQSEEDVDIPTVLPRIRDRIRFVDPDTNKLGDYIVISRAGKATGINQYWPNVKNLQNGIMKSADFEQITEWTKIQEEVLFSADNYPEVLKAQQDELDKWREYKVYDEVEDLGQEAISTRWVLTEKVIDNSTVVKARLVARGFEETTTNIRTDSPTVCKENIRLVATIAAANNWKIHSLDVKAAFLQGFPIDRTIYLVPPPEAAYSKSKLWKLNTAVYGLCDASTSWYLKVSQELSNKGATKSMYDNALFYWCASDKLQGIICCHVNDLFFAGSRCFMKESLIIFARHLS